VKAVIADDPIAYWRMGEPGNSKAINQGSLGPAADGTYTGGFSRPVPSLLTMDSDGATAFDGVNGKVNIPDVNGINTGGPFVNKSVELWFQTSDDITARQVLYEQGGVTRGMSLYIEDSQVFVGAWNTANDDGGNLSTPWAGPIFYGTDIEANAKYMLNLVMTGDTDGLDGTLNGFLNGLPFNLGQPDGLTGVGRMFAAASDIAIGSHRNEVRFQSGTVGGTGAGSWFAGVIDEVSLYNTPLTADQIAFHYYEGSIPEPGSLALLGLGLAAIARRRRRAR